jgi:hypothetical protein
VKSLPESVGQPVLQLNVDEDVDARSISSQTKLLPRPLGYRADEEGTEVLRHETAFQEQHAGGEYFREALEDSWPQDPYFVAPRRDDLYSGETRRAYPYLGEPREDVLPAESRPDRRYLETIDLLVLHQDLRDIEDRVPASSDDQGEIPLRWDDK